MDPSKSKRLYQVWKGRNKFCCGGRLILGPDATSVILSSFLIAGPSVTFCVRTFLRIQAGYSFGYAILVVGFAIMVMDLTFLFMTSTRDPGIVPRNSQPPEQDDSVEFSSASMEWIHSKTPHLRLPRTKDVIVNGHKVKVKYCDTCLLYRPPRASHCSICNNCVQRFDHHCPWVGQCIGVRNYRVFIMFIVSSTVLCLYVFTFSLLSILQNTGSILHNMSKDIVSVVLVVYCFVAVWFVGGLSLFHMFLISKNMTTYENFRYKYDKKENPYNVGCMNNLMEILLSKTPPSLNNFREWVVENNDLVIDSITQRFGGDVVGAKGKVDIEMGSIFGKDGSMPLPSILRNLDYDGIDEKLKTKGRGGSFAFDVNFPSDQESESAHWFMNIRGNSEKNVDVDSNQDFTVTEKG